MTKEELLTKSIDELVDALMTESETVAKADSALDIKKDAKTTADAALKDLPAMQDDASRGAGRPKQISDVPSKDQDGKRDGQYDASITTPGKEEDQPEADQVKEQNQIKKCEVDEAEYAEFQAFKKSQAEKKVEELKKAEDAKIETLIKSAVAQTSKKYETEISELRKSAAETEKLLKSIASRPQRSKSVTGIEALEKSFDKSVETGKESFSKSEMLDGAEELVKAGKLNVDHVIELENNGYIYDKNARATLEAYMAKKA